MLEMLSTQCFGIVVADQAAVAISGRLLKKLHVGSINEQLIPLLSRFVTRDSTWKNLAQTSP
jgi:hypothetical protein